MAEKFNYEYHGLTDKEKDYVKSIKESYLPDPKRESFEKIKKINNKIESIPVIVGLTLGIIGVLVFGLGLTFVLEWKNYAAGIPVGILGVFLMAITPYINKKVKNDLKNKYKDELLKLSDEVLEK